MSQFIVQHRHLIHIITSVFSSSLQKKIRREVLFPRIWNIYIKKVLHMTIYWTEDLRLYSLQRRFQSPPGSPLFWYRVSLYKIRASLAPSPDIRRMFALSPCSSGHALLSWRSLSFSTDDDWFANPFAFRHPRVHPSPTTTLLLIPSSRKKPKLVRVSLQDEVVFLNFII